MLTHAALIITKDRCKEISQLLSDLLSQTRPPDEIIVVDASANDETRRAIDMLNSGRIKYIRTEANISWQKNIGLDAAQSEIVSFFDDDVSLNAKYCEEILRRFELDRGEEIGGITGEMRNPAKRSRMESLFRKFFLIQSDAGKNTFLPSGFPDPGYDFYFETTAEFLASTAMSLRTSAIGRLRFEDRITGTALGFNTGRGFSEDILFTSEIARRSRLIILPTAFFYHNPSLSNRDAVSVAQALYVYSLRYVSSIQTSTLPHKIARMWALTGQGLLSILQTIFYRNPGYIKGYFTAMWKRLPD